MYILNRTSFQNRDECASLKSSTILTRKEFSQVAASNDSGNEISRATIEKKYEIKCTVCCDFDRSAYPMDKKMCNVSFRSGSVGEIFVLYDPSST